MKQLLRKEFSLCLVPQIPLFYLFVLMLLIPNYPYLVAAFFLCNAVFYSFSQGLVDNDMLFTTLLPISKADAVRAKMTFVECMQGIGVALFLPMILLSHLLHPEGNLAGTDGSITLLCGVLLVFAIFNAILIPNYYRSAHKVGKHFLIATLSIFVFLILFEGVMIAAGAAQEWVPAFAWIERHLDCFPQSGSAWLAQGIALLIALALYFGWNAWTCRRAIRNFEQVDL